MGLVLFECYLLIHGFFNFVDAVEKKNYIALTIQKYQLKNSLKKKLTNMAAILLIEFRTNINYED